jgi:dipeptidase D
VIEVGTSQRSSVESALNNMVETVQSVFKLAKANKVESSEGYPGWEPKIDSQILDITKQSFNKLFNEEPNVRAIHAGLECGIIGKKYPGIDMVSFGPTVKGAHSPDERMNIKDVEMFWDLLLDILQNIPE